MDRFDRMRLFVRVVERASFTAAARDLGVPRSTATEAVKSLEEHLGARLLDRTTRHVAPTLDGQEYYRRALAILADVDDAESSLREAKPRGLLRVHAHGLMTRTFLLPRLPDFLARYPGLELHLGQGDRLVDLVREGVDVVIRAGELTASGLVRRRLGAIEEITVASPRYLAEHGTPRTIAELEGHVMVGFVSSRTGEVIPLELTEGKAVRNVVLPHRVTADSSDTVAELARLGLGIIQAPRYRFAKDLAAGKLVEILPGNPPTPTPLTALYPKNQQRALRLRVFLDWAADCFATTRR